MASRTRQGSKAGKTSKKTEAANETLMVRLDATSKELLSEAARLRRVSVSYFVRTVMINQAKRETAAAAQCVIVMSADEQIAFWNALNEPPTLTPAQERLAAYIRGES